jgi:AraC-like DNA-binding protein
MQLPMALRPICEPVELPLGASVVAERVTVAADAQRIGSFLHFHDVAELVLFRRARGEFIAEGTSHPIGDGAITFVPSMRHHDFALEPGAMEWVLIQIDPYIVEALTAGEAMRLSRPFCVWPDERQRAHIEALADWLIEAAAQRDETLAQRIVELLVIAAAQAPERSPREERSERPRVEGLLPALERLRSSPAEPLSLEDAAAMCSLSPAYFSRRFRQVFGMTFTDYSRIHRLHLAARRLVATGAAVSAIAYGTGFSSPAHFAARFRERFGMTPREYRRSAHGQEGAG